MSATVEVFRKYLHTLFIETGSHVGDGIQQALDAGFKAVVSIELSEELFKQCEDRFKSDSRVIVIQGDSSKVLPKILIDIIVPATLWLDGHYSGGGTAQGEKNTPLLDELEILKQHPIHTHTILIDDVRLWGNWGIDIELIEQKLLNINPNYKLVFEDGYVSNDILVATI